MTDATIDDAATFDGLAPRPTEERPGRPGMLSHVAYITRDTAATADFYTRILGMELVNAVLDDAIPSTGEPIPYFHSFFRMEDGSTVAFFEAPELPPLADPPAPGVRHVPAPGHAGRQHRDGRPMARGCRRTASRCSARSTTRSSTASTSTTPTASASRSPRRCRRSGTTTASTRPRQLADWNTVKERAARLGERHGRRAARAGTASGATGGHDRDPEDRQRRRPRRRARPRLGTLAAGQVPRTGGPRSCAGASATSTTWAPPATSSTSTTTRPPRSTAGSTRTSSTRTSAWSRPSGTPRRR